MSAAEALADLFIAKCPAENLHEQQMQRYGMMFIQHLRAWAENEESEASRLE